MPDIVPTKAETLDLIERLRLAAQNLPDDYHSEAQAYFSRMNVQPSASKKKAISDFIVGCIDDGSWQSITVLHLYRMHDINSKLLNVKNAPAYDGVIMPAAGKPGITATAAGLKGDGFSYIRTGYFCPTGKQNDHHIGMISETAGALDGLACGNLNSGIGFRNAGGAYSERVNSDFVSAAIPSGKGHVILNRLAAATYQSIKDSAPATRTKASVSPSQQQMTVFANFEKASFWAGEASAFHAGAAFTSAAVAQSFQARLSILNAALIE